MTTRYSTADLKRIVEEVARDERCEMVEREVAERLRKMAPRSSPPLAEQPTRSTMTPKQISDYIDEHGLDAFHALPRAWLTKTYDIRIQLREPLRNLKSPSI